MTWKEKLIKLYLYICENEDIQKYLKSMRLSNNNNPEFTDEEVLTLYLFGTIQNMNKVLHIYEYAQQHLADWFPKLPSYQAFNNRVNNLYGCFEWLVDVLNSKAIIDNHMNISLHKERVIDSLPIIVAGKSRSSSAKVASEICSKGYCSSKQTYYYGVKLHELGIVRPATLPLPEKTWITGAQENDLTAARPVLEKMSNTKIYADKIYIDQALNQQLMEQNAIILTPVKKQKGQVYECAADNLYSALVSRVRQPIESLFNWLIQKTNIQQANTVRSAKGLLVHVWGKFAVALLLLSGFFNS